MKPPALNPEATMHQFFTATQAQAAYDRKINELYLNGDIPVETLEIQVFLKS